MALNSQSFCLKILSTEIISIKKGRERGVEIKDKEVPWAVAELVQEDQEAGLRALGETGVRGTHPQDRDQECSPTT